MQFIDTLRLKTKLIVLFILISSGLALVGIIGYFNINAMKKNLDDLYFGSFIPVNELNSLIRIYHDGVEVTVYKVKDGSITSFEASEKLSYSLDQINRIWRSYAEHYKRSDELLYVNYTDHTIKVTNRYIQRIIEVCHLNEDVHRLSTRKISGIVEKMKTVLLELQGYEMDVAREERKHLINTYENTLVQLNVLFTLIMGAVLFLSLAMFKSIHTGQSTLERTTEKLKQANIDLEKSSYTDSLTEVFNRRYFNIIYSRELKRAKRNGDYFSFLMIDIDYFKRYNDTYGHLEGDNALKAVADAINETLHRPGDYLFRLGGEEFGVIITDTDPKNSEMMAEKIRRNVEALKIEHKENEATNVVTISIGLTTLIPSANLSEEVLLSEADVNLYKAKENGRNQVALSTSTLRKNDPQSRGVAI
ncbi:MAG: diguanylate cyclase [Campylobacterota bacterium]|nr:diguanylate cyclase [Campylobacterota bacterium]